MILIWKTKNSGNIIKNYWQEWEIVGKTSINHGHYIAQLCAQIEILFQFPSSYLFLIMRKLISFLSVPLYV